MKTLKIALAASLLLLVGACSHHRGPVPCGCMLPPDEAPKAA